MVQPSNLDSPHLVARRHASDARAPADIWCNALACWLLTGLIVMLGFTFGFHFARRATPNVPQTHDPFIALRWKDAGWYLSIAEGGYRYDPSSQSNVAFYPAYPLLARTMISLLRPELALVTVSNLSWLFALAAFAFYVRARFPDAPAGLADGSLMAVALMPTGCFFRLNYSESTFLFFSIMAINGIARRWPLWSISLLVGFATATRAVGVALLVPLAIHIVRAPRRSHQRTDGLWTGEALLVNVARPAIYLPIACWGIGAFMAYQYYAFGDPFVAFTAQEHWQVQPPLTSAEKVADLVTLRPVLSVYDPASKAYWITRDGHGMIWFSLQFANSLFFVGAIGLIAVGTRRGWLPLEELGLCAFLLLIPYATRGYEMGMAGMARYVAVVFPLYVLAARVFLGLPAAVRGLVVAIAGFYLGAYAALYAGGFEMM